jgi:DHA2 family multidrug resistance protein
VAWGRTAAEETLSKLTNQMAQLGSDATLAATKKLALLVRTQATVMAIGDVFFALTMLFLAVALLTPILRKPKPGGGGGGGH